MLVENAREFQGMLAAGQRLLGFDVGEKTVGLALSDGLRMVASPLETLRRTKFSQDVVRLKALVVEHRLGGLVVGLPRNMDGSEGPRCQSVRDFARNVLEHVDLPLLLWDERWSTMAVERALLDADMSRQKRAKVVDKMAACYILQGALDALRASGIRD